MYPIKVLAAIAALSVAMLACTFTFNNQMQGVTIGSPETIEIEVPVPDSDQVAKVKLEFGAGELKYRSGR